MNQFGTILKFELLSYLKNKTFLGITIFLVVYSYIQALKRCLYLLNGETPVTDEIRTKTLLLMANLYEKMGEYEIWELFTL